MAPSIRSLASLLVLVALSGCDLGRASVAPGLTGEARVATGALSGVARYEAVEAPHAGITVHLTGPGTETETATDPTGRYAFGNLQAGPYELRFERSRYVTSTQSIEVGTATTSVPAVTLSNHRLLYASQALYDAAHATSLTSLTLAPGGNALAFVEGGVLKTLPFAGGAPSPVRDLSPQAGTVVAAFDWTSAGLTYAAVAADGASRVYVSTGADPKGPMQLATSSAEPLLCPVLSPDGSRIAYLAHVSNPWTLEGTPPATGDFRLAVVTQARGAATGTRVGVYPINAQWDYGFGPLQWTPSGLLFHKPMFCDIYRTRNPQDNTAGDGIYLLDPDTGGLKKTYYYSDFEHCLSPDGRSVYFHEGRRIYARRIDDPLPYNQGQVILGYDRSALVGNMVPGPAGDRLYYVSARGLEVMTLLVPANE